MRRGIPRAHAAVRHNSRNPQSSYNPAVLRQRRCPRQWAADIARGYRHSVGILPSPAAGECLMAAQRTRARPAGDWIGPPPSQARGPAVTAGLPVPAEDGGAIAVFQGQEFAARRRRVPVRLLSLVVVVLVPATLAAVYFFLIAADQYVAEFRFALRTVEPVRAEVGKTLDLREMFSRPEADWLTRLQLPVSIEELVRYWKSQVDAFYDITNGTIVVRASAFTPQDALQLARGVLASAERLVNDLSARARHDTLSNSEKEVRRAERRLKATLARLREFRDREGIIDPRKTADATRALAGRIRDEIVRADTE